ncbi:MULTISPECIES: threonine/serine dehydratase [unclassified Tenacibaculum]|uniref:threonine ammonia-lyase n=1 Tax=unclassified Tenacibaculum TaxID=2635139 RepID=UPI001F43C045|nr:pyridoxal-phosphate dependent enzyme [Tenacibaculum sp. Cn5-34]MCF2875373.1 pyridoxal-phosphate dependent enzyme [Tenacibaculum sp. Cn5-1]MCF2935449.1 pyridoxal-phosphate dependent enzyme [Tenacibaculum sp. Cn5-34]MCG7512009.1 pyridoxal-phosphate dependent enzyme [Tenacibaculum sp. Cn5-46]
MISKTDIELVYENIKNDIYKTPLEYSEKLSKISGVNVYLKKEYLQLTSSFKIRGVLNKVKSLSSKEFDKTFVAASTGNHAAAFGLASEKFDFKAKLFLPKNVASEKLKSLSKYKLDKVLYGDTSVETENKATQYAKDIEGVLIHPYNDVEIIKGQGTIAVEIAEELPEVNAILVPIGGGGLISGIASYFSENEKVKVIGCQPENASEMYDSIKYNHIVEPSTLNTIADAAAGGIEANAITYDICKKYLEEVKLVTEEEIKKAVAFLYKHHNIIVEPTSAVPVAALLKEDISKEYKNVVLVLTGKKINKQLLKEINEAYGDCY